MAVGYSVRIKNRSGEIVAIFDNWESLEITKIVNDVGNFTFRINLSDERSSLFLNDYLFEVYRWNYSENYYLERYVEFRGLILYRRKYIDEAGISWIVASGVCINDFIDRRIIDYPAGSTGAEKSGSAETVIKEFVKENAGSLATLVNGRLHDGVISVLDVEATSSLGGAWDGSRSKKELLKVVKEICLTSNLYFYVDYSDYYQFTFRIKSGQLGEDRSNDGLDPSTGMNSSGNTPVLFSTKRHNLKSPSYEENYIGKPNVIITSGKGVEDEREVYESIDSDALALSPYARREAHRDARNQDSDQLEDYSDGILESKKAMPKASFQIIQTESSYYGKHYSLGDKATAFVFGTEVDILIKSVSISVNPNSDVFENISVEVDQYE